MHVCTSSQTTTNNHSNIPPTTQFFTGRMPFLPPNQQRQQDNFSYTDTIIQTIPPEQQKWGTNLIVRNCWYFDIAEAEEDLVLSSQFVVSSLSDELFTSMLTQHGHHLTWQHLVLSASHNHATSPLSIHWLVINRKGWNVT